MLEFNSGDAQFDFFGLSSGQQAALTFVVEMVDKRIANSVVMIDEVELHQEEIMQRKLLHALQAMGRNNQLIVSTHSSYLAEIVPHESLITMGYLPTEVAQQQDVSHA